MEINFCKDKECKLVHWNPEAKANFSVLLRCVLRICFLLSHFKEKVLPHIKQSASRVHPRAINRPLKRKLVKLRK